MSTFTAVDARDALVQFTQNLWSTSEFNDIVLYGNNGPAPNLDTLQKVAHYEINFGDSEQVTLGSDPVDRTWGSVEFHFGVREGKGSRSLLVMQAFVKEEFKAKNIEGVKTLIPSAGKKAHTTGWVFETLYVPFYFDSSPVAYSP